MNQIYYRNIVLLYDEARHQKNAQYKNNCFLKFAAYVNDDSNATIVNIIVS